VTAVAVEASTAARAGRRRASRSWRRDPLS
jgi:hypothetical protein